MQPKNILQLVAFTLISFSLNATTFTFTGPGFWDETEYWDQYPGYLIGPTDTVIINDRCIINQNVQLNNYGLFVSGQDAIIEVIGDFTNYGVFNHTSEFAYLGVANNGKIINAGHMEVSSTFDIWIAGFFINYGNVFMYETAIQNLNYMENSGFMEIGTNALFTNFKNFINNGSTLNLKGELFNEGNNSIINNFADLILFNNASVVLDGPMINEGSLEGNGTVSGSSYFTNKGVIKPGFSPGQITFNNAALIDSNSAKTIIEIGGNNPTNFDQILGTATKTLGGTLDLIFENGFVPSNGDMFPILEGPLLGTFSQVNIVGLDPAMVVEVMYTRAGIDIMVDGTLPLDLISFEVKESNNSVVVKWESQNELDFYGYMIERSNNQREWQEIQFLTSENEIRNNQYKFQDNDAKLGSNYYRLKMINLDESFEYSKIEHIKLTEEQKAISIYPNPFVEQIYFNQIEAQHYEIYSDKGELVKTGFDSNINMMAFSSGKYYLKLGSQTIPIIKLK